MKLRATPLRMQLNTFYSGPQAWFFLAEDRGYLHAEGLSLTFTEGDTAANTVPRMAAGGFDLGYGDLNALIEHVAQGKPNAPVAVFASYNASPYTIAVPRASGIEHPAQLAGRKLVAHPNDAALLLFPEFCRATGLEGRGQHIDIAPEPHSVLVPRMLQGEWDGMFGFVNTLIAASLDAGLDPHQQLRFLEYRDHVPALYGMAVMASPALVRDEPDTVRRVLRALNRGLRDTVADPGAAIAALVKRQPSMNPDSNRQRLEGTLALEMSHPEGAQLGIGDLDDTRFQAGIDLIVDTKNLAHRPQAAALFNRAFLPPVSERVRHLARQAGPR